MRTNPPHALSVFMFYHDKYALLSMLIRHVFEMLQFSCLIKKTMIFSI
jgi:hypothetical protein